jgi:O-antigen/teichoic acid export membrane protein
MSYGIPLYIASLLGGFFLSYQNLILAMFTSDNEIGNFKAAANFITLIGVIAIPITTALLPAFSKLDSSPKEKIKAFFKLANKYTTLLIIPTAVVIITFSDQIVRIVYGSTYDSAHLFLSIYCFVYFLVGIGYLNLSSLFNGLGETRITLKTSLVNVSIFTLLAPLLTSIYRVPGLILAFLISASIGVYYASHIARTRFNIQFATKSIIKIYLVSATKSIIKIYLVSLISSIPALLLLQLPSTPKLFNVIAAGIVYLFTYATLTPLAKIITTQELETVSGVLQRIKPLNYLVKPLLKYQKKVLSYVKSTPQSLE